MNPLVFQTAIPFGHAIFLGALFVALLVGIGLAVGGLRKNPRASFPLIAGLSLIAFVAIVTWVNVSEGDSLELNPVVTSAGLTGEWMDKEAGLALLADGSFECIGKGDCDALGHSGKWKLVSDFDIRFTSKDRPEVERRVVLYKGKMRFSETSKDDELIGKLTFEHWTPPANHLTVRRPGEE
jgi:hypothetical protein